MAYGYSEFTNFTLDVYTGDYTNIQLPPVKMPYVDSDISADVEPGVYIHTLLAANAYTANQYTDISSDISATTEVINGWTYSFNFTENDYLRKALNEILTLEPVTDYTLPYGLTKVFSALHDNQINLSSIFNSIKPIAPSNSNYLNSLMWSQSPTKLNPAYSWHQTIVNDGHTLVYKQTIPGLIFEFDHHNRFVAIVAQPLEAPQHELRESYINRLSHFMSSTTDFKTFKQFLDEDTVKYVDRPCVLVYNKTVDNEQYITQPVVVARSTKLSNDNSDTILIEYLNSPWATLDITKAIGTVKPFFNIEQLKPTYIPYDPKYTLQTVYITTVANAFNVNLDVYKRIHDDDNRVLVVPDELFHKFKEKTISVWLGVNAI